MYEKPLTCICCTHLSGVGAVRNVTEMNYVETNEKVNSFSLESHISDWEEMKLLEFLSENHRS